MIEHIQYLNGGLFSSESTWIHPRRTIDNTEIIIMRKGVAPIEEDGIRYEPAENEVLRLDSGRVHCGFRESVEPVSFYWFHFNGVLPDGLIGTCFRLPEPYRVNVICKQLLHYANTPAYPPETTANLFRVLLMELHVQYHQQTESSRVLGTVCAWIRAHDTSALTSAGIATQFGYNEDYLSRLFRARFGYGLKQYLIQTRMRRIKTLLLSPDYSLKQIAEMTGFSDYKYFLKFFTQHEGSTPTAFRSLYFNTHTNIR